jgi:CheY-like chemotaxis protein
MIPSNGLGDQRIDTVSANEQRSGESGQPDKYVLVVDDQKVVIEALRMLLECWGHKVLSADGGREAMEIVRQRAAEIEVVLTDLMMPDMDGVQTVRALREIAPHIKFIGISGAVDSHRVHEFMSVGLVALLPKPFGTADLMNAIRKAMASPPPSAAPGGNPA